MRWLPRIALLLLAAIAVLLLAAWLMLRASLPQLDGPVASAGISASVSIERDASGIPTVRGATLQDVAFGTGFVHAQDRYFQMDLSRRLAAGELAALFGPMALEQDRKSRLFRFRMHAREVLADAGPEERGVLDAYARGVNAGLASLGARPFEYWLLRTEPVPWSAEDSALVVYSMWWQLQYGDLVRERLQREVAARIESLVAAAPGGEGDSAAAASILQFLFPRGTEWDAPNFGTRREAAELAAAGGPAESPPVPPAELLDLRRMAPAATGPAATPTARSGPHAVPDAVLPGSNGWAVAGSLSASGAALVANDMHLGLGVPATWYRVRQQLAGSGAQGVAALELNGVSLPGIPALVAGSNGHIAWGFTNSYGDWSDVIDVSCSLAANQYATNEGERQFAVAHERIEVQGAAPSDLEIHESPLGVLFSVSPDGRRCSLARWLAAERGATNFRFLDFERATDVATATAIAAEVGMPQQNLVIGDRAGRIAWTVIGRIPLSPDGPRAPRPVLWRDASTQPAIVDPEIGRIWTANARVVEGEAERTVGGDEAGGGLGYDLGARAGQIRDDLLALREPARPADMLAIQLDDRALFLDRWRRLLLLTLDEEALKNQPRRAELRRIAERWEGRASVGSAGYRVVREFRRQTELAVWKMLLEAIGTAPGAQPPARQFEGPLWRLVTEQPEHLLATPDASWRDFLLRQVDELAEQLRGVCEPPASCTWGARNRVALRHPLSRALPWLAPLLDMPVTELPGDNDMPRVQVGAFGASERFAVSPGREAEGYLQLPGGQSGHPLSPYYRAGFDDWVQGRPTPFLPGPAQHKLLLQPSSRPP
jgi:penicillin G amidase